VIEARYGLLEGINNAIKVAQANDLRIPGPTALRPQGQGRLPRNSRTNQIYFVWGLTTRVIPDGRRVGSLQIVELLVDGRERSLPRPLPH